MFGKKSKAVNIQDALFEGYRVMIDAANLLPEDQARQLDGGLAAIHEELCKLLVIAKRF